MDLYESAGAGQGHTASQCLSVARVDSFFFFNSLVETYYVIFIIRTLKLVIGYRLLGFKNIQSWTFKNIWLFRFIKNSSSNGNWSYWCFCFFTLISILVSETETRALSASGFYFKPKCDSFTKNMVLLKWVSAIKVPWVHFVSFLVYYLAYPVCTLVHF